MADSKLEALRARIREEAEKKNGNRASASSGGDNASYPFWDIPENAAATLRFLPDKDNNNPFFWIARQTIRLPFQGVVGGDYPTDRLVTVTVPCVDMFGDICPIIAATRPWWNDERRDKARKYYKKRSYITQGFVVSSPLVEANTPENPIRRFVLGSALLEKIKAGLVDPDMENLPTDYLNGCDFRIRKTRKGEYNNYDTSEWARRSRALTESEMLAIEQYGLWDLKEFKGARPDADGVAVIRAMFEASVAGEPFDYASFGSYYRPFGGGRMASEAADALDSAVRAVASKPMQPQQPYVSEPTTTTTLDEEVEAVENRPTVAARADSEPQDLLARLRQRTANRG
jgi:hypothetical protein